MIIIGYVRQLTLDSEDGLLIWTDLTYTCKVINDTVHYGIFEKVIFARVKMWKTGGRVPMAVRAVPEIILRGVGHIIFSDPSTPSTNVESEPPDPRKCKCFN